MFFKQIKKRMNETKTLSLLIPLHDTKNYFFSGNQRVCPKLWRRWLCSTDFGVNGWKPSRRKGQHDCINPCPDSNYLCTQQLLEWISLKSGVGPLECFLQGGEKQNIIRWLDQNELVYLVFLWKLNFKMEQGRHMCLNVPIQVLLCYERHFYLRDYIWDSSAIKLIVRSEKAMAPYSSTLPWEIPWTEEPGRLQSMGSLRVEHDWATSLSLFTFMQWRRKWQPTPVFLPGESQGQESLVGWRLWGHTESDTTEVT